MLVAQFTRLWEPGLWAWGRPTARPLTRRGGPGGTRLDPLSPTSENQNAGQGPPRRLKFELLPGASRKIEKNKIK